MDGIRRRLSGGWAGAAMEMEERMGLGMNTYLCASETESVRWGIVRMGGSVFDSFNVVGGESLTGRSSVGCQRSVRTSARVGEEEGKTGRTSSFAVFELDARWLFLLGGDEAESVWVWFRRYCS